MSFKVLFNNQETVHEQPVKVLDIVGNDHDLVCAYVNGHLRELTYVVDHDAEIVALTCKDSDAMRIYGFKPCIWDRGSNLGGVIASSMLRETLAAERYFDLNLQSLLEGCYKVCLDDFPSSVNEHVFGIDKPVRDRMKGLIQGVKDFIDADTLRDFSHFFTVKVGNGKLSVCTMLPADGWRIGDPVADNFLAAVCDHLGELDAEECIAPGAFEEYLARVTAAGVRKEDVMNHFWEIDNKPVEDTLYWEEVQIDMSKHKKKLSVPKPPRRSL